MPRVSRTQFRADTNTLYPDNTTGEISPADLRAQMDNIADSATFRSVENTGAPTSSDDASGNNGNGEFNVGDIWIDETNDDAYICLDDTDLAAVWLSIGNVNLPTQDDGSTVVTSPSALNFTGAGVTVTDVGGVATIDVPGGGTSTVDVVSNVVQDRILGRISAGSGDSEELTPAQVRTLLNVEDGATADQTGAEIVSAIDTELGGSTWQSGGSTPTQDDGVQIVAAPTAFNFTGAGVTVTDVGGVATIDVPGGGGGTVDVVSNVATDTILGRTTAGSGDSEELTPAQVRTLINVADGADVSPVTSVAGEVGVITDAALRTALNVEDGATADQTGAEIVSAIDTELGGSTWQTGGGSVPAQDDGVQIVAAPTALNFTGAGVTVTDVGGVATIDVASATAAPATETLITDWLHPVDGSGDVIADWTDGDYDKIVVIYEGIAMTALDATWAGARLRVDTVTQNISNTYENFTTSAGTDTTLLTNFLILGDDQTNLTGKLVIDNFGGANMFTSGTVVGDDTGGGNTRINGFFACEGQRTNGIIFPAVTAGSIKIIGIKYGVASGGGSTVDVVSNVATDTILGRTTAGSGDSEELTPAQVRTLINVEDGATADQTGAEIVSAIDTELGGATWQSGGGSPPAQDDGVEIVAAPSALNFTGAGVTVTDVGGVATIDVPGGSSGTTYHDNEVFAHHDFDTTNLTEWVVTDIPDCDEFTIVGKDIEGNFTSWDLEIGFSTDNGVTWTTNSVHDGFVRAGQDTYDVNPQDNFFIEGGSNDDKSFKVTFRKNTQTNEWYAFGWSWGNWSQIISGIVETDFNAIRLHDSGSSVSIRAGTATVLIPRGADTGGGSGTVDVVSNVAQDTILGRTSSGSGDSEELTPAQVRSLINVEDGATADMTGAEIKAAYEAEADTNAFTDAEQTKLGHISVTQAVDLDQMETDIAALANGMVYQGTWDASGGSFPGGGTAQTGAFYTVSVGGTVDGEVFAADDRLIAITDNASTTTFAANWTRLDATDAVQSVAGEVGTITASALRTAINVEDGATADQTGAEIVSALDTELGSADWQNGGDVTTVGTPGADEIGIWTGSGTLGSDSKLLWDGAFGELVISGNIFITGTVDGRDVASDGSKLDGIEAGATADQTGAEIVSAIDTELGGSTWQSGGGLSAWTIETANVTVSAGDRILANTSGGAFTVTLPESPTTGDEVWFADIGANWATNNLTVDGNGANVDGAATFAGDVNEGSFITIFDGTNWIVRFVGAV